MRKRLIEWESTFTADHQGKMCAPYEPNLSALVN